MAPSTTLKDLLKKAIEEEIHSRDLYMNLSQKANNASAKEALQELSRQEQGHQDVLERYLSGEVTGGMLSHDEAIDYKIAEKLDTPELSVDMESRDVFLLAANREKAAHDFYQSLADIHPEGEIKDLLEELAEQESQHKQHVEFLYTEVAFPQTDGG